MEQHPESRAELAGRKVAQGCQIVDADLGAQAILDIIDRDPERLETAGSSVEAEITRVMPIRPTTFPPRSNNGTLLVDTQTKCPD